MKPITKKIIHLFRVVLYFVIFLIAILLIVSLVPIKNNFKFLAVTSGSMAPTIPVGSAIFIMPTDHYLVKDIVTFRPFKEAPKTTVTHRIIGEQEKNGKKYFITKGDANGAPDLRPIDESIIIGEKIFTIPYIGYLLNFTRTELGLILVIIIPVTLIIYHEIGKIRKEIQIILKNRRQSKSSKPSSKTKKITKSKNAKHKK